MAAGLEVLGLLLAAVVLRSPKTPGAGDFDVTAPTGPRRTAHRENAEEITAPAPRQG
ncbi:hypothetical protein AB0C93_04260 [Streptomyces sp. NPDC048518]|uniref:hypothetical protein n=1 Tax=Streptomyces sp. NPDC048518 TaxID=3155029 RepID=UPI0033F9B709